MEEQKPSMGRVVIYNHPGSADGLHAPKQSPAIVLKVNEDETLDLFVMSVYGGIFFNRSVKKATAEDRASKWEWPTRV